jgi:hypothetical protein
VPVAATRLADVGPGDSQPPVLGRRRQHLPQQLMVALLQLVALTQCDAGVRDSLRKGVSDALQLAEIGDPRRPRQSGNAGVDLESWESFGGEVRQLPLEAPDLAPQLGPRQPLVAADSKFV